MARASNKAKAMKAFNACTFGEKIRFINDLLVAGDTCLISSTVNSAGHALFMLDINKKLKDVSHERIWAMQDTLERIASSIGNIEMNS